MRVEPQIRAARPDRSVLLSASAGSGKTRALVHRMIHLLAAGAPPGEIVAATFSEKAAAQMEERLYTELAGAAEAGKDVAGLIGLLPEDAPYPIVMEPERILSELSAHPDALRISTIHALCLSILRRFPLEAGLPPDFSVMDEWEIAGRREEAVDACLDGLTGDALLDDFDALASLGYSYDGVRSLILAAFEKRPHLMKLAQDAGGPEKFVDAVVRALDADTGLDAADEFLAGGELQPLAASLSGLIRDADELTAYKEALGAFNFAGNVDGFKKAFGKLKRFLYTKKGEPQKRTPLTITEARKLAKHANPTLTGKKLDEQAGSLKHEHDGIFESLRDTVQKLARLVDYADGARALLALLRLFFRTEDIYTGSSRSEGLVDYDDLEICAYGLLRRPESAGLLASVESRVAHLLVDEFQDTGELQWGILERLASEAFSGKGAEGVKSPTLFAVGDGKQSIYRFRMANRRIMGRLRERMESTIEPEGRDFPELEHNFRSAPEILRVVDETFSRLLPDEYKKAVVFRQDARGSVTFSLNEADKEPGALAYAVESALGLPVYEDGAFRPAGYGDMAILMRTRTRLSACEDALRARGIPFKVVGGVGFFRQPEIRAVLGLLNFLDDPADTLSLAAALKSPLFGLTDGELEPVLTSPQPLDVLDVVSPDAHTLISRWRGLAGVSGPGLVVEDVIARSAAEFVFGMADGPAAILNLEKLAVLAREFDRKGGAGLSEFTGWVSSYRESSDMAGADVELPEFSGKFVSIMTVHAAKGLEFPVVFIAGADVIPRDYAGSFLAGTVEADDLAVSTASLLDDNPIYGRLKELEKAAAADESKRLLYVAMTRAMDHLFISAGCRTGKDGGCRPRSGSWAGLLLDAALPSLVPEMRQDTTPPVSFSYPAGGAESVGRERQTEAPVRRTASCPPPVRLARIPEPPARSFISPSALANIHSMEPPSPLPYPAMLRGSAIHRALESFGKTGGFEAAAACAAQPGFSSLAREDAERLVADVDATVCRFLAGPAVNQLITPGENKYFELPLMLEMDGDVVYGSADLVVREGDTVTVYDFKSGLTGITHGQINDAYRPQLAAYSEAAREAFGASSARSCIILVDTSEFIIIG